MSDPARISTKALMDGIEADVRNRLRVHLVKRGGPADYEDAALFERVREVLNRAVDERNASALLLPELLDSDLEWELQSHLLLTTHRQSMAGRAILFVKRRVLLPMTRWLFEYSQENFRRQQRINLVLFACIEELAIENARLIAKTATTSVPETVSTSVPDGWDGGGDIR